MIRIGIPATGFLDWTGGVDFLHSVIDSIHAADDTAELHLLLVEGRPRTMPARWWQALRTAWAPATRLASGLAPPPGCEDIARLCSGVHRIGRGRRGVDAAVARLGLDVLLPSHAVLPRGLRCPWIGYLYDFQHRRLPDLFTPRERGHRDRRFAAMMARADAIVVNSRDTAAEGRLAYPAQAAKLRALPFNACPREQWLDDTAAPRVEPRFSRGLPYFMVSNQFWVHKDHPTAFKAFARLIAHDPAVQLVCTGDTSDYRRPAYFAELRRLLDELGVADRVSITGLLPKPEQIALLRNCVALVQPTLCEGGPGGGAVYDAVALGVRSIVSNIPINRELNAEPTVTFFPTGDAEALAACMAAALSRPSTPLPVAELRAAGRRRRAACGRVILDLVAEVCAGRLGAVAPGNAVAPQTRPPTV